MDDPCNKAKWIVADLGRALYNPAENNLPKVFKKVLDADCEIHFTHPIEDLTGPESYYESVYAPLIEAVPNLERRDYITIAGEVHGEIWVGCAGFYSGVFVSPWLVIPSTMQIAHVRFHEFYRVVGNEVVEIQCVWDIPALMMQAGAWPMSRALGVEWLVPGPATQDGRVPAPRDNAKSAESTQLVADMLLSLGNFASGGVDAMQLDRYWHPSFYWGMARLESAAVAALTVFAPVTRSRSLMQCLIGWVRVRLVIYLVTETTLATRGGRE